MKKKSYVTPTCREIPLQVENHFCVVSKWKDGTGGGGNVINPGGNGPLPDAGGKEWNFDDDENFSNDFSASWNLDLDD